MLFILVIEATEAVKESPLRPLFTEESEGEVHVKTVLKDNNTFTKSLIIK